MMELLFVLWLWFVCDMDWSCKHATLAPPAATSLADRGEDVQAP